MLRRKFKLTLALLTFFGTVVSISRTARTINSNSIALVDGVTLKLIVSTRDGNTWVEKAMNKRLVLEKWRDNVLEGWFELETETWSPINDRLLLTLNGNKILISAGFMGRGEYDISDNSVVFGNRTIYESLFRNRSR